MAALHVGPGEAHPNRCIEHIVLQLIDTQLGIHARAGLHLGRGLLARQQHGDVDEGLDGLGLAV